MTVSDRVSQHFGDLWSETEQHLAEYTPDSDEDASESKLERETEQPTSTCQLSLILKFVSNVVRALQGNWFHLRVRESVTLTAVQVTLFHTHCSSTHKICDVAQILLKRHLPFVE